MVCPGQATLSLKSSGGSVGLCSQAGTTQVTGADGNVSTCITALQPEALARVRLVYELTVGWIELAKAEHL
jgi:hypothetical protein